MLDEKSNLRWYEGISRYQWLVLIIASLGWVFDIFEGQVFVASMNEAMPDLLGEAFKSDAQHWNNLAFGSFLLGGALGGVLFGILGDKIGRSRTMMITILFYSVFTCVTAFAQEAWQMVGLRFFVAMGVGGEWAVASAMVAEVMPKRSRAVMSSIFHASSVFGTLLAAAVGAFVVGNTEVFGESSWRWAFAIGLLPALLTIWVRFQLKEPEQWQDAQAKAKKDKSVTPGQMWELFTSHNIRATLVGVALSSIGLTTFWGGHIYGKNALKRYAEQDVLKAEEVPLSIANDASADEKEAYKKRKEAALAKHKSETKQAEMLSMVLNTIGGGLGLVLFGVISNVIGRKGAFILYHVVGFLMMLLLFLVMIPGNYGFVPLAITLPVFGFFTLGMHAGYAVYFPELYPTRLRGTGTGFCFNMGRLASAGILAGLGAVALSVGGAKMSPDTQAIALSPLYLLGVIVVLFARETKDDELPE